jgi:hypothetical protein
MQTEKLSAYTLDSVSVSGGPYLFAYDNPYSMNLLTILLGEQDEIPTMKLSSGSNYSFEILRIGYSFLPRESERPLAINHFQEFDRLNTEFLSPLHSPSLQHIPATPSTHPLQKPVSSFSSNIARLICSFHGFPLVWIYVLV